MGNKKGQSNYQLLQIIFAFLGTVLVAYFGYLGIKTQSETPIHATQTAIIKTNEIATQNVDATPTLIPPTLIFSDSFESDKGLWTLKEYEEDDYSISRYIENGTYHRVMKTSNTSDGNNTSSPIPNVITSDFCLLFDAKVNEATDNTLILVYARIENFESDSLNEFYRIEFNYDGTGIVVLDKSGNDNQRQIAAFSVPINWKDGLFHKIQISFQGNNLEIKELPNNNLVRLTISEDNLILHSSEVRIGNRLPTSNQLMNTEFDNLFVYDKCP